MTQTRNHSHLNTDATHSVLIERLTRLASSTQCEQQFSVDGIQLALSSIEPSLVAWVMKYLQPISLSVDDLASAKTRCFCLYSDQLLIDAAQELRRPGATTFEVKGKNVGMLVCTKLSASLSLFYCGSEGLFWLIDADTKTVYVVFSSRTNQPALEFARTVRTIVLCHLETQGWVKYHAGAVLTDSGLVMIIGNSGAGKTSLIADLVAGGADYVANEVLLVKHCDDGIYAMGYPMAIAVGIGTALQFKHLAELVDNPDELMYPRHRFNKRRVARTPPAQRHNLDDKLQLLPEELVYFLGAGGIKTGGKIQYLLVPRVAKSAIQSHMQLLNQDSLRSVLDNNFMGLTHDRTHPVFREFDQRTKHRIDTQDDTVDALSYFSGSSFSYTLSPERDAKMHLNMLHNHCPVSIH